jgi:hypothetical protein
MYGFMKNKMSLDFQFDVRVALQKVDKSSLFFRLALKCAASEFCHGKFSRGTSNFSGFASDSINASKYFSAAKPRIRAGPLRGSKPQTQNHYRG